MKNVVIKFIEWLKSSFGEGNASSRRLTAFWYTMLLTIDVLTTITLSVAVTLKQLKADARAFDALEYTAIILVSGTAALLGITTWQNIQQLKSKKDEKLDIQNSTDTNKSGDVNTLE